MARNPRRRGDIFNENNPFISPFDVSPTGGLEDISSPKPPPRDPWDDSITPKPSTAPRSAPTTTPTPTPTPAPTDVSATTDTFNIVDWYSDLSSQDNTAAIEALKLQAYQNFDPNRGELAGTNSTGWATEQLLGIPFIDKVRETGVSQSQATASTLEIDYPYDYDGNNLYMKVPETGGNTNMYQGFSDEDRKKYMDLQDRGSFIDITGGTAGVGEYSMLWVEDPPEESKLDKLLNLSLIHI